MNTKAIYGIARMEFVRVMTNPVVLLAEAIVIILGFLNGSGGVDVIEYISSTYDTDTAILQGFGQISESTGMICTIMAAFVSATTIPYERWKGTVNLLMAKPLYRSDFVIGKFTGLAGFTLLFVTFTVLFAGLWVIVFFRGPLSLAEYVWRVTAYILIFTLACWLVIALNMFFGIVLKNVLSVTAATVAYIFIDCVWYSDRFFGGLSILTPHSLFFKFISPFTPETIRYCTIVSFRSDNGLPALFHILHCC